MNPSTIATLLAIAVCAVLCIYVAYRPTARLIPMSQRPSRKAARSNRKKAA
jgi:hypothetical protein